MAMENLSIATVRYDRNFCRIYASPAYLQIVVSERAAEILGKSIDELWWPTNISAKAYRALLAEVMASGNESEIMLEWTDGDGLPQSYIEKLVPEYDGAGEIIGVSVLVIDVSHLRRQQIIESHRQRVFERLACGDDLPGVLTQVALYVESAKPGVCCCILVQDERQVALQLVVAPSMPESYRAELETTLLANEMGRCRGWPASLTSGARVIVDDPCKEACLGYGQCFVRDMGTAACWFEPILSSSGQLQGVLCLYLKRKESLDQEGSDLLLQASRLSALAIERKAREQRIYSMACYDALTGLPNRRLFGNRLHEEIIKAERGNYGLAVLFIDLDRFKEVNDTLGHRAGDDLLMEAAKRMRSCVRESDTLARLGGDEFVIILPEIADAGPFERVAQQIVAVMQRPFDCGENSAYVTASVGVALYPFDGDDAESLLHNADKTMYVAKEAGRNTYSISCHRLSECEQRRLQLSNDLRGALDKGQFEVHYQPIVDVDSGQVVKAEALLRWQHPEFGAVPLDQFIPMAEKSDLILEIGNWVFHEAVDLAKRWNALVDEHGSKQISVNMSAKQFTADLDQRYAVDYLQAVGLNPASIAIEITEGTLLQDFPELAEKLENLHAIGIQLALDDFGVGMSALSNLQRVSIDYLKIDRSFIVDLETNRGRRAIVEAMVMMAQRLGLKVIAEGVETAGQKGLLAAMGCNLQQGFFYSHPVPVESFLEFACRPQNLGKSPSRNHGKGAPSLSAEKVS
ncbi:MAG: EAL domain-containing protein [Methylomonas sp.]|nr:EAL domain-containing protein [Methylomonas sp.]